MELTWKGERTDAGPPHTGPPPHPRNWLVFCHARDIGCLFLILTVRWTLQRTDSRLWNSVHKQRWPGISFTGCNDGSGNVTTVPQGLVMFRTIGEQVPCCTVASVPSVAVFGAVWLHKSADRSYVAKIFINQPLLPSGREMGKNVVCFKVNLNARQVNG